MIGEAALTQTHSAGTVPGYWVLLGAGVSVVQVVPEERKRVLALPSLRHVGRPRWHSQPYAKVTRSLVAPISRPESPRARLQSH